jgi:hypothetical protein
MRGTQPLELTTVYVGSHASVAALEGLLEAEGIPTFVPDRMTKTADPFITGYSPLELMLQVPNRHEAEARALVALNSPPAPAPRPMRIAWRWIALLMLLPMALAAVAELLEVLNA